MFSTLSGGSRKSSILTNGQRKSSINTADPIILTPSQRRQLEQIARHPRTTQKVARRVAIVLGAGAGLSSRELAHRLATSRPTVLLWRQRFEQAGVEGLLRDAPRPGRHKRLRQATVAKILRMTLQERPRDATP
jgi:transposase